MARIAKKKEEKTDWENRQKSHIFAGRPRQFPRFWQISQKRRRDGRTVS